MGGEEGRGRAVVGLLILLQGILALGPRPAVAAGSADVDVLTLDDVVRITLENNRTSARPWSCATPWKGGTSRSVRGPAAARRLRRGSRSWDTTQEAFGIPPGTPPWAPSSG